MARTGRRRGPSTSRDVILEAARRRFADAGYAATSFRAIAADAGVDPAVVGHFFGSKDGLFRAVVGWPFDPAAIRAQMTAPGPDNLGARVARVFLEIWEDPTDRASLLAVLRSAMTQPTSATLLREFAVQELFGQLTPLLEGPDADLRVNLVAAQLIGVALLRYVIGAEPIASASTASLIAWLTPSLNRYLSCPEPSS